MATALRVATAPSSTMATTARRSLDGENLRAAADSFAPHHPTSIAGK